MKESGLRDLGFESKGSEFLVLGFRIMGLGIRVQGLRV